MLLRRRALIESSWKRRAKMRDVSREARAAALEGSRLYETCLLSNYVLGPALIRSLMPSSLSLRDDYAEIWTSMRENALRGRDSHATSSTAVSHAILTRSTLWDRTQNVEHGWRDSSRKLRCTRGVRGRDARRTTNTRHSQTQ